MSNLDDAINFGLTYLEKQMHQLDEKKINCCRNIYVIGGGSLIEQVIRRKDFHMLYLTKLNTNYDCDKFINLDFGHLQKCDERLINNEVGVIYQFVNL